MTAALAPLLGPYFPPDWQPPPPTAPEQPGILLLLAALGVVVGLAVLDAARGRLGAAGRGRAEPGPMADGLTVTWLPIDAATLAELAMTEELAFGRHRRGRLPRPTDAPVDGWGRAG